MLGKLLKFDLKSTYRSFLFIYLVLIVASLFMSLGGQSFMGNIISGNSPSTIFLLITAVYSLSIFGLLIMMFVNVVRSYYLTMFKKTAYLTHTLPVTTTQLLLSKVIMGFIWIVLSVLVIFLSVFIISMRAIDIDFAMLFKVLGNIDWFNLELIAGLLFLSASAIETILLFYFILSAVHTRFVPRYRAVVAIVLYFAIDYVRNFLLGLFFPALSYSNMFSFTLGSGIYGSSSSLDSLSSLQSSWLMLGISSAFVVLYFFATKFILDKKLEIE